MIRAVDKIYEDEKGNRFILMDVFLSVWIYRLIRFVLSALFIWSGFLKILDPRSFGVIIEAFGLVPEFLIIPIAIFFPWVELLSGAGLLLNIRGSLGIITCLLAVFMAVLGYGIWVGLDVDCGCFGPEDPESEAFHGLRSALYRDFVMIAAVMYLYWWRYVRSDKPAHLFTLLTKIFKRGVDNEND